MFVCFIFLGIGAGNKALASTLQSADGDFRMNIPDSAAWQDTMFVLEQENTTTADPANATLASLVYHVTPIDAPVAAQIQVSFPNIDGPVTGTIAYHAPQNAVWTFVPTTVSGSDLTALVPAEELSLAVFARYHPAQLLTVHARSAAILDTTTGTLVAQYHADQQLPLASLTKVMTALVLLDTHPKWSKVVTFAKNDIRSGAALLIRPGEQLTMHELFGSMLVGSANNATMALVHNSGLSEQEFVRRMNAKAQALGLAQTTFVEPTGLDAGNVSTAAEYAQLARIGTRQKTIARMMTTKVFTFTTRGSRRITHHMKNSDTLLGTSLAIQGGKTGYTEEAGYSMMIKTSAKVANSLKSFITVVMGSASSRTRFAEAKRLAELAPSL